MYFAGMFQNLEIKLIDLKSTAYREMAGVVGFEPTVHDTKNRCLTTWLHPNGVALITMQKATLQV